jgi:hypothetical protein
MLLIFSHRTTWRTVTELSLTETATSLRALSRWDFNSCALWEHLLIIWTTFNCDEIDNFVILIVRMEVSLGMGLGLRHQVSSLHSVMLMDLILFNLHRAENMII